MIKIILIIIALLVTPHSVFAESSATVRVDNNIESSSNSTVKSTTNIRVETNGKVTTYSSDKAEDVEVKSVNGESEIKVNGKAVYVTQTPSKDPSATPSPTPVFDENDEESNENDSKNIIDLFEDLLKKVFSVFG